MLARIRVGRVATSAVAIAAATVVLTATPAFAIGFYSIGATTGSTYQLQSNQNQNLIAGRSTDDELFQMSVDLSGRAHLPFQPKLYGFPFKSFFISSNGNIQFGGNPSTMTAAFTNDCLPSATFSRPALMPFWDDLFFDSNDLAHFFREGIYVKKGGTAPHRFVMISWQGHEFSDAGAFVLVQVRFNEGSSNPVVTYGANGGASATIGVQRAGGAAADSFTQFSCNPGSNNIVSGERLHFVYNA
jgi:hypothetical protein